MLEYRAKVKKLNINCGHCRTKEKIIGVGERKNSRPISLDSLFLINFRGLLFFQNYISVDLLLVGQKCAGNFYERNYAEIYFYKLPVYISTTKILQKQFSRNIFILAKFYRYIGLQIYISIKNCSFLQIYISTRKILKKYSSQTFIKIEVYY